MSAKSHLDRLWELPPEQGLHPAPSPYPITPIVAFLLGLGLLGLAAIGWAGQTGPGEWRWAAGLPWCGGVMVVAGLVWMVGIVRCRRHAATVEDHDHLRSVVDEALAHNLDAWLVQPRSKYTIYRMYLGLVVHCAWPRLCRVDVEENQEWEQAVQAYPALHHHRARQEAAILAEYIPEPVVTVPKPRRRL